MRVKTVTIAVLAALCLFQAVVAQNDPDDASDADDAGDDEDNATDSPQTTTQPPVFHLEFERISVDTNAIGIQWSLDQSFSDDVDYFYVTAQRDGSEFELRSPEIDATDRKFNVDDLVHESGYTICLHAVFENGTEFEEPMCKDDDSLETIPFVRDDSLIVLFCVLGCIFLMILMGYLCWSYAKKEG